MITYYVAHSTFEFSRQKRLPVFQTPRNESALLLQNRGAFQRFSFEVRLAYHLRLQTSVTQKGNNCKIVFFFEITRYLTPLPCGWDSGGRPVSQESLYTLEFRRCILTFFWQIVPT